MGFELMKLGGQKCRNPFTDLRSIYEVYASFNKKIIDTVRNTVPNEERMVFRTHSRTLVDTETMLLVGYILKVKKAEGRAIMLTEILDVLAPIPPAEKASVEERNESRALRNKVRQSIENRAAALEYFSIIYNPAKEMPVEERVDNRVQYDITSYGMNKINLLLNEYQATVANQEN